MSRLGVAEVVARRAILLLVAKTVSVSLLSRAAVPLSARLFELSENLLLSAAASLGRAWRLWSRLRYILDTRLPQAVVDGEIVQLGQVLVHAKNLLVLNSLLQFSLSSVALLLLFDEFLNFGRV